MGAPNLNAIGGGDEAGVAPAADTAAAPSVDYKAKLLALLALPPEATDEQIDSAILAAGANQTSTGTDSQKQISDLQGQLSTASTRVQELEAAQTQREQAEIDALLAEAGELPEEAKAALRNALGTDRAGGMALLSAMKKPAATASPALPAAEGSPAEEKAETPAQVAAEPDAPQAPEGQAERLPPAPKHDPKKNAAAVSEEDLAKRIRTRATELQKTNKRLSFQAAFSQAEKELKKQ